jgi:hypothetical protein
MSLQWQRLRERLDALGLPDDIGIDPRRPLLHVDIDRQRLCLLSPEDAVIGCYPVSTAANGRGQREGSFCTPTGWHRICEKIGAGEPLGRVFRGRHPTDEQVFPEQYDGDSDPITSRILRLEGLEPGHNRGGDCDSQARYIYLHGTADEARIGRPVSRGCIRLRNADILELFDRVRVGDALLIE